MDFDEDIDSEFKKKDENDSLEEIKDIGNSDLDFKETRSKDFN